MVQACWRPVLAVASTDLCVDSFSPALPGRTARRLLPVLAASAHSQFIAKVRLLCKHKWLLSSAVLCKQGLRRGCLGDVSVLAGMFLQFLLQFFQFFVQFLPEVRDYKDQLSRQPASAEEFVAHLQLIEEVEAQRPVLDKEFVLVSST